MSETELDPKVVEEKEEPVTDGEELEEEKLDETAGGLIGEVGSYLRQLF